MWVGKGCYRPAEAMKRTGNQLFEGLNVVRAACLQPDKPTLAGSNPKQKVVSVVQTTINKQQKGVKAKE